MSKLSGFSLGLVLALASAAPSTSDAVYFGDTETVMRCNTGYVTVDGYTWASKTCWTEVYYTSTGSLGYGLDSAFEWEGYGGTRTWSSVNALQLPGHNGTLSVNITGKKAWSTSLSCSDETDFRQQAVQAAAAFVNTQFPIGHAITLYMPNNQRQSFTKASSTGSYQFLPSSACISS